MVSLRANPEWPAQWPSVISGQGKSYRCHLWISVMPLTWSPSASFSPNRREMDLRSGLLEEKKVVEQSWSMIQSWPIWSCERGLCPWQGGWNQVMFKVPLSPSHSITPCLHIKKRFILNQYRCLLLEVLQTSLRGASVTQMVNQLSNSYKTRLFPYRI